MGWTVILNAEIVTEIVTQWLDTVRHANLVGKPLSAPKVLYYNEQFLIILWFHYTDQYLVLVMFIVIMKLLWRVAHAIHQKSFIICADDYSENKILLYVLSY